MPAPHPRQTEILLRFQLSPDARVAPGELRLLQEGELPQALRLELQVQGEQRCFLLRAAGDAQSLYALDAHVRREQWLGLARILPILEAMQDARERLFRPSFRYLRLHNIYYRGNRLKFPVLPLQAGFAFQPQSAEKAGEEKPQEDFWSSWGARYHIQKELAALGRELSEKAAFRECARLFRPYIQLPPPGARRREELALASTAPLPRPGDLTLARLRNQESPRTLAPASPVNLLLDGNIAIGRDPARCGLVLSDPCVGRRHARIRREGSHFYLEDGGSCNGTWIDGIPIPGGSCRLLPQHCLLRFGQTTLRFDQE